jgi:hypothetical protein
MTLQYVLSWKDVKHRHNSIAAMPLADLSLRNPRVAFYSGQSGNRDENEPHDGEGEHDWDSKSGGF